MRTDNINAETEKKSFWTMVMDPKISSTHFKKVYRECLEHKEEIGQLRKRSISRREFMKMSAGVASAFGLASMVGSMNHTAWAAPTAKGVKKGTMRIGYINTLDCELLDYILEKKGIFESMGWDTKWLGAPSGPAVMEAFIAKEIDFAYVGSNTPGLASQKGIPSKHIIGGMMGHGGWCMNNEAIASGVKDFPSLFEYARKRKKEGNPVKISTQVPGTLTHASCLMTVKDYGLDPDKDIDMKYLPPPEVASTVITGIVDGDSICEQYGTYPEFYKMGNVIGHCLDSGPNMMHGDGLPEQTWIQCTAMAARPGLPQEMVQACIEGHKKAAYFLKDNIDECISIAAGVSGTPPPVEWVAQFRRSRWHYGLNWESCDSVWNNSMKKLGLAKKNFKLDDLVDTKNSVNLKPPFESICGVNVQGPLDVCSDKFRRNAWAEGMKRYKI